MQKEMGVRGVSRQREQHLQRPCVRHMLDVLEGYHRGQCV